MSEKMGASDNVNKLNLAILSQIIYKKPKSDVSNCYRDRKQKEHFISLVKAIKNVSDGQAYVEYEDNFTMFNIGVLPSSGAYVGGKFVFRFHMPVKYPQAPPRITCLTKIYHPNIDDEGEICMSLFDDWCPEKNDLLDCVQGLLFLFHQPNLDDPLSPYFSPEDNSMDAFHERVYKSLMGEEIDGIMFERNYNL